MKDVSGLGIVVIGILVILGGLVLYNVVAQAGVGGEPPLQGNNQFEINKDYQVDGKQVKFLSYNSSDQSVLITVGVYYDSIKIGQTKTIDGLDITLHKLYLTNNIPIIDVTIKSSPKPTTGIIEISDIALIYLWSPDVFVASMSLNNPTPYDLKYYVDYKITNLDNGELMREQTITAGYSAPFILRPSTPTLFELLNKNRRIGLTGINTIKFDVLIYDPATRNTLGTKTQVFDLRTYKRG